MLLDVRILTFQALFNIRLDNSKGTVEILLELFPSKFFLNIWLLKLKKMKRLPLLQCILHYFSLKPEYKRLVRKGVQAVSKELHVVAHACL